MCIAHSYTLYVSLWVNLSTRTQLFHLKNWCEIFDTPGIPGGALIVEWTSLDDVIILWSNKRYRISANSFLPWIVSALLCTVSKGHSIWGQFKKRIVTAVTICGNTVYEFTLAYHLIIYFFDSVGGSTAVLSFNVIVVSVVLWYWTHTQKLQAMPLNDRSEGMQSKRSSPIKVIDTVLYCIVFLEASYTLTLTL